MVLTELHRRENLTGMHQKRSEGRDHELTLLYQHPLKVQIPWIPAWNGQSWSHDITEFSTAAGNTRLSFNFGVLDDVADFKHQMMAPRQGRIWVWSSSLSSIDKASPPLSTPWQLFWDQNLQSPGSVCTWDSLGVGLLAPNNEYYFTVSLHNRSISGKHWDSKYRREEEDEWNTDVARLIDILFHGQLHRNALIFLPLLDHF